MSTNAQTSFRSRQAGVSLVELVMFIVIVSIGIAGILSVMDTTTKSSADPMVRKQAFAIAESMMEEIQLKDFANPADGFAGTASQANRPFFDDIGDYHAFATTGIYAVDGPAIAALANFNVRVAVTNSGNLGGIAAADVRLITVTVTGPGGTSVVLEGYRANYEP